MLRTLDKRFFSSGLILAATASGVRFAASSAAFLKLLSDIHQPTYSQIKKL